MPPRKKLNSSSKKSNSNQQSQPSKFGIQHFFERHSQNNVLSQKPTLRDSDSNTTVPISQKHTPPGPHNSVASSGDRGSDRNRGITCQIDVDLTPTKSNSGAREVNFAPLASKRLKNEADSRGNDAKKTSPSKLVVDLVSNGLNTADNLSEVSPEISKSVSLKRFKFSPGMLIKQSQDDGGDEVTWKISPVNERLQAVSKKMPESLRVLADSSRLNSSRIQRCSQNKTSPCKAGKVAKRILSPRIKTSERPLISVDRVGLKRVKPDQDKDCNRIVVDSMSGSGAASSQSPFQTPPSLSYCHDKQLANNGACNEASDQMTLRRHKRALLELLDQVEDVISVDNPIVIDLEAYSSKVEDKDNNKRMVKVDPAANRVTKTNLPTHTISSLHFGFLVLEVTEKCGTADSSGVQRPYKVLRLLNEHSGEERAAWLWEEWFYSAIAPGDTVNIIGEFDDEGKCHIDRNNNYVILHPDILVSGTRVASSFSCPRRTVLDERLKCNEHSIAALIGTLLHQIFQAGLTNAAPTVSFLEEYARMVLLKNLENVYASGANEADILKTFSEAVPKLLHWITLFKHTKGLKSPMVEFRSDDCLKNVHISEVIDIEEMAWAPKYGLKGMIDASVRVDVSLNGSEPTENIMPLEFKTGKIPVGQSSMEHSAQVILYTLLMSERYEKHIGSGLLYYLQSDQTQGIAVQRSDLVGLIMRRNELANDILKASLTQLLPPMLRSPSMCKGCRHLNVCTVYHKAHGGTEESSGLGDLFVSYTQQLTTTHGDFLRHWERLIDLEAKETQSLKKTIWRSHSLKSDLFSNRLSSIILDASDDQLVHNLQKDNRFIYRFVHQDFPRFNSKESDVDSLNTASSLYDLSCSLKTGDYVILSTESGHLNVASGIVADISRFHVSVSFSKRLRLPGSNPSTEQHDLLRQVWRIDKDEFMTSYAIMRFNLVQLFLQRVQSAHLRKLIVDLEVPRFDSGCIFSQDPAISYVWSEKNLNNDQRRAILKILTAKDYALILGMPGTGKTSTMVHAVKALLMRGASILLTSYTNNAVDNLLMKLKAQDIDFVRIGRYEATHEEVRGHCFSDANIKSVEDIRIRMDQVKVVAVTCLGITSPWLVNKRFDICIMDEAGQTTLPVSLGPLMFASTFVLVGDHYQLPPLVQSTEARENGMGISLFCRLSEAHPEAISALQSQYRMCQGIMELSNALIYGDRLRCGTEEIANAKLKYSSLDSFPSWLKEVFNPRKPVIFIDTDTLPAYEEKDNRAVNNPIEAHIIVEVTQGLVDNGIEGNAIGIITPYNSQANLIRHAINLTSIEIHTIDKYQGRDKDCILVSFVRSSENSKNYSSSLLGDWHRINVAVTRAKKKLVMVGSCKTLSKVPLLKLLIQKVDEQSGVLSVSKEDIKQKRQLKRCSNMDW